MTTPVKHPSRAKNNVEPVELAKQKPHVFEVDNRFLRPGDTEKDIDKIIARAYATPEFRSASIIQKFEGDSINLNGMVDELREQSTAVHGGDMKRAEAMLIGQAHALDSLFANMARRAHSSMEAGHGSEVAERYMKLALRAQNQCRTTLETLSTIKNPPVVFAKQMNVSNGPQQVNNGVGQPMARDVAHVSEIETEPNKVGGSRHELLENTRTSGLAGRTMQEAETVAASHRAKD